MSKVPEKNMRRRLDRLIGKFADKISNDKTFKLFGKPKTAAWYTNSDVNIYITTGWYVDPDGVQRWAINLANIIVAPTSERQGCCSYIIATLRTLAETYDGMLRVECVNNPILHDALARRGFRLDRLSKETDKIKTYWEPNRG